MNAALAEAGELPPGPGEIGRAGHREGHVESRSVPRPHRIVTDRLGEIRTEPPRSLEGTRRPARGRRDTRGDTKRRCRSVRLGFTARPEEVAGGLDEIPVGPHPIEDAVGDDDRELRFERHRQLDEIE